MICIAVDPTCRDCLRRTRRDPDHECDDLCAMGADLLASRKGHEAIHAAQRCRNCGTWLWDEDGNPNDVRRRCQFGKCTEWCCPECGEMFGADGPVSCRCSSPRRSVLLVALWLFVMAGLALGALALALVVLG